MATLRSQRYNFYKANHFLPFEADALTVIPKTYIDVETGKRHKVAPIKFMVDARRELYEGLQREGQFNRWSKTRFEKEFRAVVLDEYKRNGWLVKNPKVRAAGIPDPYQMFDYYRQEAVKAGKWRDTPTKTKTKHGRKVYDPDTKRWKRLDKVKLSEQRKKMRDKKAGQKQRQQDKLRRHPMSDRY